MALDGITLLDEDQQLGTPVNWVVFLILSGVTMIADCDNLRGWP